MVKPGDASMASPFTAKQGHIMPCTDILKQGRSTLVTTVQMFKILGLLCLSTAYSLSVMYLQVTLPTLAPLLCACLPGLVGISSVGVSSVCLSSLRCVTAKAEHLLCAECCCQCRGSSWETCRPQCRASSPQGCSSSSQTLHPCPPCPQSDPTPPSSACMSSCQCWGRQQCTQASSSPSTLALLGSCQR